MKISKTNWRGIYRYSYSYKKSGKILKMINKSHNKRIQNYILHGKIKAGRPIKNILYSLKETQQVTAQIYCTV